MWGRGAESAVLVLREERSRMQTTHVINIVATDCQPDEEQRFNLWYDGVHVPFLLEFGGLLSVARYKLASAADGQARYLAIYEFASREDYEAFTRSPEVATARAEMRQTWGEKGLDVKWRAQYELLRMWQR